MTKKHSSKEAFTLIEMLIVITIIGILTVMVALDFNSSRQRQSLALLAEQSLAILQQGHAEVNSGLYEEEFLLCKGAYFRVGEVPLLAKGIFDGEECIELETESYGFSPLDANVAKIEIGGLTVEETWALFIPPDGRVAFYSSLGDNNVGNALIEFQHSSQEDLSISLAISYLTNQVSLISTDDEK